MNWFWLVCVLVSASIIMVALGAEAPERPSANVEAAIRRSAGDGVEMLKSSNFVNLCVALFKSNTDKFEKREQ